ncbi:MAG TPA: hypothetical protein VKH34_07815 [Vicinamibacterales bacterium]|nr:hypothetical protein [Vicinamibacterales bacterium]
MPQFSAAQQRAIDVLARDLDQIFGARLKSLVAYPGNQADGSVHSCAVVDGLAFHDLAACLPQTEGWHHRGAAVPLMLASGELERTIDIFPLEYSSILADYLVVRGLDPFKGMAIAKEDVRRATEGQAKSHLIHLREAFLESHGETTRIARLIASSAAPLRGLLVNIARLDNDNLGATPADETLVRMAETRIGVPGALIREILAASAGGHSTITDPSALLARYVDAAQKIWAYVDGWHS